MHRDEFEHLVVSVLDTLPAEFTAHLENVEIIVDRRPTREQRRMLGLKPWHTLYGLYEGVPLTEQSALDLVMPATIFIFQQPLERDFPKPSALREQVRRTLLHELAHHFGISDDRLHELGAY
jgi:predicted Zn-dependent protease with MMP-like domain